jgi:DNA-directed RNA polymerase specialized sigma24 family protein
MTILDKYNPSKGSKAFSYFSVITKNWFINKVKKQQKQREREVDFDNIAKHYEEEFLSTNESYLTEREHEEFWSHFYSEIKSWDENQIISSPSLNQKTILKFLIKKLFIYTCVR